MKQEIGWLENVERAKKPARLPVVLTRDEVRKVFAHLQGTPRAYGGFALRERASVNGVRAVARSPHEILTFVTKHYVYVLRSSLDQQFYVGLTNNLPARLEQHNAGLVSSTKRRAPFE